MVINFQCRPYYSTGCFRLQDRILARRLQAILPDTFRVFADGLTDPLRAFTGDAHGGTCRVLDAVSGKMLK